MANTVAADYFFPLAACTDSVYCVQLNGFVESRDNIQRATEVARNVDGVRSVENNLRVKPSS